VIETGGRLWRHVATSEYRKESPRLLKSGGPATTRGAKAYGCSASYARLAHYLADISSLVADDE
jgi:hypothetical protein